MEHDDKLFDVFPSGERPAVTEAIKNLHSVAIIFREGDNFGIFVSAAVGDTACKDFGFIGGFFGGLPGFLEIFLFGEVDFQPASLHDANYVADSHIVMINGVENDAFLRSFGQKENSFSGFVNRGKIR